MREEQKKKKTYSWVVVVPIGRIRRRLRCRPGMRRRRRRRGEVPEPHVGSGHRWGFPHRGVPPDVERTKGLELRRRWRMPRREPDCRSQPRADVRHLHPAAADLPPLAPARGLRLPRQQMLPMRSVFLHTPVD